VHDFIEEIQAVAKGNPIFSFGVSSDISRILGEQWAGLFQRLLQENATKPQNSLIEELQRSLATVGQLVQFLSDQSNTNKTVFDEILFASHPLFSELRKQLVSPYRVYFRTISEFEDWLIRARQYSRSEESDPTVPKGYLEWTRMTDNKGKKKVFYVQMSETLFKTDGTLVPMGQADWRDSYLAIKSEELKMSSAFDDMDDDIPF
jgi:hypothetical protein